MVNKIGKNAHEIPLLLTTVNLLALVSEDDSETKGNPQLHRGSRVGWSAGKAHIAVELGGKVCVDKKTESLGTGFPLREKPVLRIKGGFSFGRVQALGGAV